MKLNSNAIPFKYPSLYFDKVEDHFLVYNPFIKNGLSLLNKEADFFLSLVDGKKSLKTIFALAKKKDKNLTFLDVKTVFSNFYSSGIVYFNNKKMVKTKLAKKRPLKLSVWLHLTNQCNLRCTYCYISKTPQIMSLQTAYSALEKIFVSAKKHQFKKVLIKYAGGEPLLEFKKLLLVTKKARVLAKTFGLKAEFVVLTNAVLATEFVAKKLKKHNIKAAVSLDGTKSFHNKTRVFINGKGSFNKVKKGLDNLLKEKVSLNISITITSKNISNIPVLTKYLLKKNIPFNYNFYRENPYVTDDLENNDKKLIKYLKRAYTHIYNNPPPFSILNALLNRVFFHPPHLNPCGVGHNYIIIRHDGMLASCQMTIEKSIGSIKDKDMVKTMQQKAFTKGISLEDKKPCSSCQWKYVCCGGCPLLTKKQKGSFKTSTPYCSVYKALIPEVLKLEAKRLLFYSS